MNIEGSEDVFLRLLRSVRQGEIDPSDLKDASPELQREIRGILATVERQREVVRAAEEIATGNLDIRLAEEGEDDRVAVSLNQMVLSMKSAVTQALAVAQGDYTATVSPRGTKDELGRALSQMTARLRDIARVAEAVANSQPSTQIDACGPSDLLAISINRMTARLSEVMATNEQALWLAQGSSRLADAIRGELQIADVARKAVESLCRHMSAQIGALYVAEVDGLHLAGTYAYVRRKNLSERFALGEGLVGQCAYERQPIVISQVPTDYIRITSGLGDTPPRNLVLFPLIHQDRLVGVVEIGSVQEVDSRMLRLLERVAESVAIALDGSRSRNRLAELLEETRRQAEEVQAQSEELQQNNQQLEEQSQRLKESAEEMQIQSEGLRQANEELQEQTTALAQQKRTLETKNSDLESVKRELEAKAAQLEITSRYKSDFMATMSHELRTPLNSLLILSQQLAENPEHHLSAKEVEYAQTIHTSGHDLLTLINEILDLAKIESGTVTINAESVDLSQMCEAAERVFRPVAEHKGLAFSVEVLSETAPTLTTDRARLQQVVQNLLGNAIKFTEKGRVALRVGPAVQLASQYGLPAPHRGSDVAWVVEDTGVGIPVEHQELVFEAFRQMDCGPARRHPGTGLGLAICRQVAALLGGSVVLHSEPGKGSAFALYLPLEPPASAVAPPVEITPVPACDSTGTMPTPVAPLSDASKANSSVLVVGPRHEWVREMASMLQKAGVATATADSMEAAVSALGASGVVCVVLDPDFAGASALDLVKSLRGSCNGHSAPEMVIETARALAPEQVTALSELARALVVRDTRSPQRVLEEVRLALQGAPRTAPKPPAMPPDGVLAGRHVLVVDDDLRNIFALTSLLERHGMKVSFAENGRDGVRILAQESGIDLVLMDIMMPGMDGYEAMRAIRAQSALAKLPIIAVTAKAMTGDRDQCMRAGASDYIAKPIDTEQLLSLLRVWLYRS